MIKQYVQELWTVPKDTIYAAITAVKNGVEYTRECLATHDRNLGRSTKQNFTWAVTMEEYIRQMEVTLALLQACSANR
jgi:hypothetical protein